MAKEETLVEKLLRIHKEMEATRVELAADPEQLKVVEKELAGIDKDIEKANKKLVDLKATRKEVAGIVSIMTGGKAGRRAPSGRGKSKDAFNYIAQKGVGATVTVKEIQDASDMLGGAAGAWTKRAVDAGFLEQEVPRGPYTIVKIPAS